MVKCPHVQMTGVGMEKPVVWKIFQFKRIGKYTDTAAPMGQLEF